MSRTAELSAIWVNAGSARGHSDNESFSNAMRCTTMNQMSAALPSCALEDGAPPSGLVARLQRGEPAAVGEAYDLHHEAVRAFATRLTGEAQIAEDLVQEAFVALPRAMRRYRGDSSLRSFIVGIVVNHARHYVRSASRRRAALAKLSKEPTAVSGSPEHDAERARFVLALARAMDALSLDQRVAFVLCDVEGHASSEAARITGAPEATMRTRLFHARKRLRSALVAEGYR